MKLKFGIFISIFFNLSNVVLAFTQNEVLLQAGTYAPFFRDVGEKDQSVGPLLVDRFPVTNNDFKSYLAQHREFVRSKIQAIFAGPTYLEHWQGDLDFKKSLGDQPVTNISWFLARRYCESKGKRLMSIAEWEYAADSANPKNLDLILDWYSKSNDQLASVSKAKSNKFNISGMHGLIWEWVEDFSSVLMSGDSRASNEASGAMFCGSGSLKSKDPTEYASFMRFAHRSSLKANSVGRSLGFRCARDVQSPRQMETK